MKRIIFSLAMITLAGSVAVGVTKAYFSSSGSVAGNSVATGTLNYHINSSSAGKPWQVSAIQPGYVSGWESLSMENTGTLDLLPYFYLDDQTGSTVLYDALEIDVADSGGNTTCGDGDDVSYYSGLVSGITGLTNKILVNQDPDWGGVGYMPAGEEQMLCQKVRFPDDGGDQNSLQGLSTGFTEYVYGAQVP